MSKSKGLVRLLGPSIYGSESIRNADYPVVVEAGLCTILTGYAEVTASSLEKMGVEAGKAGFNLTWFNPWISGDSGEPSWEHYTPNPFEAWNALKASREVGAMPQREVILR